MQQRFFCLFKATLVTWAFGPSGQIERRSAQKGSDPVVRGGIVILLVLARRIRSVRSAMQQGTLPIKEWHNRIFHSNPLISL